MHLGYVDSPLSAAAAAMLKVRRPTGSPNLDVALAWHIVKRDGVESVVHDGGTFGYVSIAGFNLKSRVGIVVLANAFTLAGVSDFGLHLLDPAMPAK
jgi:hypothetical protein